MLSHAAWKIYHPVYSGIKCLFLGLRNTIIKRERMWSACRLAFLWAICVARIFANFININKGREGSESSPQKKTASYQNQSVLIKPMEKWARQWPRKGFCRYSHCFSLGLWGCGKCRASRKGKNLLPSPCHLWYPWHGEGRIKLCALPELLSAGREWEQPFVPEPAGCPGHP